MILAAALLLTLVQVDHIQSLLGNILGECSQAMGPSSGLCCHLRLPDEGVRNARYPIEREQIVHIWHTASIFADQQMLVRVDGYWR